jgi:hypothetical protein
MAGTFDKTSPLLAMIPSAPRKPEQVAFWQETGESPTYTLLRAPNNLKEFNQYNHGIAIWRENETMIYVVPSGVDNCPRNEGKGLYFGFFTTFPRFFITGKTDKALAETAQFVMDLREAKEGCSYFFMLRRGSIYYC